ncbi:MAG TPA: TonB family protein [Bacteroidia bacterium]|nr:TonB family protein [Bacteroidia bacterium]HRD39103.1 TonB family protein [Bacteroidia bacterium]
MKKTIILFLFALSFKAFPQADEAIKNPDVMPEYPGGSQEMMKFISSHLKTDSLKTDKTASPGGCKSLVEFTVDKAGKVGQVFIVRSCVGCAECDALAVRAIEKMPLWKPGLKDGKPVSVKLGLPVFFTLK